MGINECSKPASKSSWDSQDFGDVNMVLKMVHFRKSSRPQWVNAGYPSLCALTKIYALDWSCHVRQCGPLCLSGVVALIRWYCLQNSWNRCRLPCNCLGGVDTQLFWNKCIYVNHLHLYQSCLALWSSMWKSTGTGVHISRIPSLCLHLKDAFVLWYPMYITSTPSSYMVDITDAGLQTQRSKTIECIISFLTWNKESFKGTGFE